MPQPKTTISAGVAALALLAALFLAAPSTRAMPLPLHTSGNQLLDSHNRPVWLQGVDVPSLEWTYGGDHMLQSVQEATKAWHANIIRVTLSQEFWFGKMQNGQLQDDGGAAYRMLVRRVVRAAEANGSYVILDLHWNDRGQWSQDIGQHKMPDEHSVAYWTSVAATFANNPAVLFDLYNEPHDVSEQVWRDGGMVTDNSSSNTKPAAPDVTYQAPGMQTLLDTVRATGAKNVVVIGQLDWAYSTKEVTDGGPLHDSHSGHGIVYANHAYPFKGESVDAWDKRLTAFSAKYPVIISEFGSDPGGGQGETGAEWVQDVLARIQERHWSYTAWSFHPAAGPVLLNGWDYTPSAHFGVYIKAALAGQKIGRHPSVSAAPSRLP